MAARALVRIGAVAGGLATPGPAEAVRLSFMETAGDVLTDAQASAFAEAADWSSVLSESGVWRMRAGGRGWQGQPGRSV